jgi:hypothetical protein
MPRYYTYLISSLPSLQYATIPPLSMGDYLRMLAGFIPENELATLHKFASEEGSDALMAVETIRRYFAFDTALRNHLVRLRSTARDISPEKYVRPREELIDQSIEQYALEAYKSDAPLESEKVLDLARWGYLEEMGTGHIFDYEALLIYAMKLKILLKWHMITEADKNMIFNATIASFNLKDLPISRS